MIVLAIDCSAAPCAACVYDAARGVELGREVRELGKGHAEHLIAVIDTALRRAGRTYKDIDRIAVSVGPGSFTGLRVGVATARGLALALKVPALGVSNLEAVAEEAGGRHRGRPVLAAFASAGGAVQAALYGPLGEPLGDPAVMTVDQAARLAAGHEAVIAGSAAAAIAASAPALRLDGDAVTADIGTYARLAAGREPGGKPRPLYLREPDAKPQAGFVVPRTAS